MSISKIEIDTAYIKARLPELIENISNEITKEMRKELFNLRNWYFDNQGKKKKKHQNLRS